ncbi:MAG: GGDEF domain-containing protein [Candidatus Omnitrophica bacterium]|nr:GGDEF domain-containing protein [Candidatus Omnitrophota bacterium]
MMAIDKTSISIVYFSGLILSVVYGYSCWSLRFNYAVFCGWTSLIFYAVTAFYIRNTPLPILINNISFCAIANFIGMFIAYILETTLRKEYRHSIEMKKTQKNLHDLSLNDDVVKIPNRRFFNLRLLTEFNDLREKKQPLSLIIADVDYFKNYNDSSGHVAGDECLRKVAEQLQHLASYVDSFVARFGGEEFAIILPNTSLPEARITEEKIRKIFKNQKICHPASPICDIVTLSFGVATIFPSINTSPENLIKAADSALYAAKENGRDRVEICPNTA